MLRYAPWFASSLFLVWTWTVRRMQPAEFLIIAGLVLANGFFVAAEFALVKVRVGRVDQLAEAGHWAAKLTKRAVDRLDAYLSAAQLGVTVSSLALGFAIEKMVQPVAGLLRAIGLGGVGPAGNQSLASVLSFTIVTFLHMALGEQAPKSLAIRAALPIALFSPSWSRSTTFSGPSSGCSTPRALSRSACSAWDGPIPRNWLHTEEELRHIVAESVAGGHLTRSERILIENVLNLEEKTARRVMVPRPDIAYLSLARPLEDNLRVARQTGHTRFPLCEDDLTTVIGMIHVKDLFRSAAGGGRPDLRKSRAKRLSSRDSSTGSIAHPVSTQSRSSRHAPG